MNKIFAADGTTTVTDNGTQALFNAKNMGVRPFNEEDANMLIQDYFIELLITP